MAGSRKSRPNRSSSAREHHASFTTSPVLGRYIAAAKMQSVSRKSGRPVLPTRRLQQVVWQTTVLNGDRPPRRRHAQPLVRIHRDLPRVDLAVVGGVGLEAVADDPAAAVNAMALR